MVSMQSGVRRRRLGMALLVSAGLGLTGCGGGGLDPLGVVDDESDDADSGGALPLYDAFVSLEAGMDTGGVEERVPGTGAKSANGSVWRWETDAEILVVKFVGVTISEADWTNRSTGRTEHRSFLGGSGGSGDGSPQTLYETYVALRSGMTKSDVAALAPVGPSQGYNTDQVLWVLGEEALGVKFNGSTNSSVITFAQWGLSIAAGGRNESRNF